MLKMSSMIDIQIPFSRRLKKKPFPTKNKLKVLQPKLEPGFTYLIGLLTTTLPRQHNRNGKKFYYTNTIQHLFVIKSVTCVFQNSLSQFIFILSKKKALPSLKVRKHWPCLFHFFSSSFLMTWLHGGSNLNQRLYGLAGYLT